MGIEALLIDLVQNTYTMGPRLRLAVSATELIQLRDHLLKTEGLFHRKIRGLPLVVEEDPSKPISLIEFSLAALDADR